MKSQVVAGKPAPDEYAPYYGTYISLIQTDDVVSALEQQRRDLLLLLSGRDEEDGNLRYAPGKWSVKEVLGHISDSERIFSCRALRIARNDPTPLAGFEQDDYVREGPFAQGSLADGVEDFIAVRRSTVSLLRSLGERAWLRRGVANQNEVTVRAIAYIIAGHELHHRRILEQRYFRQAAP
jgi:hypothetical protein